MFKPVSTYREFLCRYRLPVPTQICFPFPEPCLPPCPPDPNEPEPVEDCKPPESCYSVTIPRQMGDCCGSKVTYDFGPDGITKKVNNECGDCCYPCDDTAITLEAYKGGPSGCLVDGSCIRIESKCKPAECCPPPPPPPPQRELCIVKCPPKPCPPSCKTRRKVWCGPLARETVGTDIGCGCQAMICRPRFRNP